MTIQTQSEQSCAKKSQRERLAGHNCGSSKGANPRSVGQSQCIRWEDCSRGLQKCHCWN